MRLRLASLAGVFALWITAPLPAAGLDLNTREILASGDAVPQFGRVGTGIIDVQGIDGRGRVLVTAQLSNGAEGLFWAADDGVTALWSVAAPGGDPVRIGRAVTNARGDVIAAGLDAVEPWNAHVGGLYRISDGTARALVRRGAVSDDGDQLCDLGAFAINDAGVVAFSASPAVAGDCAAVAPDRLYVIRGHSLTRLAVALPDEDPRALHLLGIAADGTVLVDVVDAGRVLAVADGVTRTLVTNDITGPSGTPINGIRGTGSNAAGDVAFLAWGDEHFGVYRTRGADIIRAVSIGDSTPDGFPITSIDATDPQLGDAGDVTLSGEWMEAPGHYPRGPLVIAPDGTARVAPNAEYAGVNAAGAVALFDPATGLAARWERDSVVPLLRAGDPAPGGAVFAARGIGAIACLGADGRVGAQAVATDGTAGLLCGDAGGVVKIARVGEPAPGGGRFASFGGCAFATDGSIVFGATRRGSDPRRTEGNLYRATAAGIERLAGPGTVTTDGEVIDALVTGINAGPFFNVNGRDTVLLGAWMHQRPHLLRLRPGAAPVEVPFDLGGPPIPPLSLYGGIDADDRVYAVAGAPADQSIVVADDDGSTVLTTVADLRLPLGPVTFIDSVRAGGNRLVIFGKDADQSSRIVQYTTAGGFEDVLADRRPFTLLAFTEQRTLIQQPVADGALQLLLDPDGLHTVGALHGLSDPVAFAVNDRSNLLFRTDHTALGTERQALSISGPAAAGGCFAPPTAAYTDLPTPTATPAPADCTGDECARLIVGSVSGDPGDAVQIAVSLDSGPWVIVGAQADLAIVPMLRFATTADGRPACHVNPDIDKNGTAFAFEPTGCELTDTCTAIRGLVLSIDDLDTIPSGAVLFTCDATIAADAAPGMYPLPISYVGVSDPNGVSAPAGGVAGVLDVQSTSAEPQQPGAVQAASDSGGCQVVDSPGGSRGGGALLGLAGLLLITRRRSESGTTER